MNKKRFIELIQQPEIISQKDVQELEDLVREYPYFQNAYFLIAKGNKENKGLNTSASIQRAAVFAPDRAHLKKFLDGTLIVETKESVNDTPKQEIIATSTVEEAKVVDQKDQEPVFHFNLKPAELISFDPIVTENSNSENLINELQENLKKLQNYREGLESAEKDFDKIQTKKSLKTSKVTKEPVKETPLKPSVEKSVKASEQPKKKLKSESKSEPKKVNKPKVLESKKEVEKVKEENKAVEKPKPEKKSPVKSLPKEEQIKIIEQFIESSPQIPKVSHGTVTEDHHTDLTYQLKYDSGDFNTENLAIIMEKQGKTEKAIEIYNKLIWKFPQKKAYFASQIEKLKK